MDRPIGANALIVPLKEEYKKIKHAFDETSVFQAPNDVALYGALMQEVGAIIGMIENAPTIDIEPQWIPCKERLPEENRTVIASTECGVFPEARYTKEDGWEWAYESGADYWEKIAEVKAWMPLPEPYEVKDEKAD